MGDRWKMGVRGRLDRRGREEDEGLSIIEIRIFDLISM